MKFFPSVALWSSLIGSSASSFLIVEPTSRRTRLLSGRREATLSSLSVSSGDYLSSLSTRRAGMPPIRIEPPPTTPSPPMAAQTVQSRQQQQSGDYLSSLSTVRAGTPTIRESPTPSPPPMAATQTVVESQQQQGQQGEIIRFYHAPISYFAVDKLTSKGPRKNADVGQPHDSTRPLVKLLGPIFWAGSWWCAAGGWPSPSPRATTEIFYVFSGHGCVTDLDNTKHYFGPGDTVILPKGWSGRWDVLQDIHKVWFVHDHANIEETSNPIRATVTPYNSLVAPHLQTPQQGGQQRTDAVHGSSSTTTSHNIYHVGPTQVGCWTYTPGSPCVGTTTTAVGFHVLEGVFFLTNAADGSAQRCVAGDTVVLPKGWTGQMDIIETVRKLQVVVE